VGAQSRLIQGFQIGEASEGRHLKSGALEFARRTGNTDCSKTITCLIREENRHSAYLGAFMRHHGLPFATTTWTDEAQCRRRSDLGIHIEVDRSGESLGSVPLRTSAVYTPRRPPIWRHDVQRAAGAQLGPSVP
jgi:hypothetical protein